MSVRVASLVAERLKAEDLRKLGNLKKVFGMLRFDGKYLDGQLKAKLKTRKKPAVKHSIQKPILLISLICLQPFVQDCGKVFAKLIMW